MMASVGKEMPDLDQVFDYLHQNKDQTFDYDLRSNNCEHYCTLWKYGIEWSSQVNTVKNVLTTGLHTTSEATREQDERAWSNKQYKKGMAYILASGVSHMAENFVQKN